MTYADQERLITITPEKYQEMKDDLAEGERLLAWFLSYSLRENPHMDGICIVLEARDWLDKHSPNRKQGAEK